MHTDTPAELVSQGDGVTDDAAYNEQIIGCNCRGPAPVVGASIAIGGLGDIAVGAGLPTYLFTAKNLSDPTLRRRLSRAIGRMSPKLRRRVLDRLKVALSSARVSGAIRNIQPAIGWTGVTVGRCPYANVAGPLTP